MNSSRGRPDGRPRSTKKPGEPGYDPYDWEQDLSGDEGGTRLFTGGLIVMASHIFYVVAVISVVKGMEGS